MTITASLKQHNTRVHPSETIYLLTIYLQRQYASLIVQSHIKALSMKLKLLRSMEKRLQRSRHPILRLFLQGVYNRMQLSSDKPYNYYFHIAKGLMLLAMFKWLSNLKRHELDTNTYNWFVPGYLLKVREESHVYWELARLAKGLPTTFTYYKWSEGAMYEIDRKGRQTPYLSHPSLENTATFDSLLHEQSFPASPQRHAEIMMYLKNIDNPYDLRNYLLAKPVNLGDWLRMAYYAVYRELGLTNRWRYDEFVAKPDVYYRWEKLKLAHLLGRDRDKLH